MSGAAQPRRVVASGPNRRRSPSNATRPVNRLQPADPLTCSTESNVIVGTGAADSDSDAGVAARHVVPARLAAAAMAGVNDAAGAGAAGCAVVPAVGAPHPTASASKTPKTTISRTPSILAQPSGDNPSPIRE